MRHDVFVDLPEPIRWQHVLLADGNIGLGGRPVQLLERIARILVPGGTALVELSERGELSIYENVQLQVGDQATIPVLWATVGFEGIDAVAVAAGLIVTEVRPVAGRYVAHLRKPPRSRPIGDVASRFALHARHHVTTPGLLLKRRGVKLPEVGEVLVVLHLLIRAQQSAPLTAA